MSQTLVRIEKVADTKIGLTWSNGDHQTIAFTDLRFECRCAQCVDEWTRERKLHKSQIDPYIKPLKVEPVGQYAIQIEWSDGHATGIYPFEHLYEIGKTSKEN
ncbi:MAG: DUF971 domain-containing protein [Bacteriovoracia bacterium]